MKYQPKLNEKYMPFLHCISSFEGTSYKHLKDTATSSFISCFTLDFTSVDIIFHKFLELHYLKKKICHKFSFFNGFTQTPPPSLGRNSLSMTKVFC